MFLRYLALVCACTALAGCQQISAGLTPVSEKVNKAFPLADSLQTAHNSLMTSLESDKAAQQLVADQYNKLMELRALTCIAKTPIGRFDTVAKIKTKVTDLECFQKQDVRLAEWISLRRLALVIAKPPLFPLADLPAKALLPNYSESSGQVAIALAANVMVVKVAQKFNVIQLPTGKQLGSFPAPEQTYRPATLSANGRVLAVPVGSRNLLMIEVDTGNVLWNTEEYSELIAWLPQVEAAVLAQTNTGAPQLLDLKNSKIDAYPATEKRLTWALSLPLANGNYLVGAGQTASLMAIARTANGALEAAPLKQWRLAGNGNSSATPFLMSEGSKLVYQSGQDLSWLDLQTEKQGTWQLSALNANGFSKLSEQTILFDSYAAGATPPAASRLLDISQGTVAIAKNLDARDGALVSLLPRAGYLKRSSSAVIVGSAVEIEPPQLLELLVSDALLAKQLARVAAASAETDSNPERARYIEQLSAQVRAANAAAGIRDGLPRETIDAIRRGSNVAGGTPLPLSKNPLLTDIPANAKTSVIGVYEGASASSSSGSGSPPRGTGQVRINVQPGATPLVLVLSSYEPVNWIINSNGRKISAILMSSYHESKVTGAQNVQVLKMGSRHAYKMDTREYELLKQDISRYVSNPVQSFQGSYKGQDFSVQ